MNTILLTGTNSAGIRNEDTFAALELGLARELIPADQAIANPSCCWPHTAEVRAVSEGCDRWRGPAPADREDYGGRLGVAVELAQPSFAADSKRLTTARRNSWLGDIRHG